MSLTNSNNKMYGTDRRLTDLRNALYVTNDDLIAIRTGIEGDIIISGDINIPGTVTVDSTPENPVHNHITEVGTSGILNVPYLPVSGTVELGSTTLSSLENITVNVGTEVSVYTTSNNTLAIQGTVYQGTSPWVISGDVNATMTGTVEVVPVGGASTVSAFGEPYGLTITPVIQLDAIYGITSEVIQTYTSGTGSGAQGNPYTSLFQVNTGTTVGGYGVLRSKRFLRYRAGQGALCRFTAAFTPNVANTSQRAGLFNQENAIMVGWNQSPTGPKFGVMRASGGRVHITVLTINTAPTGNQTATVTLNGVAFPISITAGSTQATAVLINKIDGFTGWYTDQVDNTIVFMSTTLGPKNGTYSFSSTGAGTLATGTFSTKQVGVAQTENWTYQGNFSIDNLNGSGPSGMNLSSQYLNVFQINFRWLGAGEIRYAIEDQTTGNMVFFHHEHYVNQNSIPHVAQPSFKIGYVAYSTGSTTDVTVTGASMMGAIEGDIRQNELNRSSGVNKTGLVKDVLHHLLTIRNPYVTNGAAGALNGNYILNAKEIILKDVSIGTQNTDPAILYIFYEPTSFSGTHSYFSQPKDNGMISTVDGTLNNTVDTAICQFVTAINGQSSYALSDFRVAIPPGSWVSFAIKSTNGITRATLALVFSED